MGFAQRLAGSIKKEERQYTDVELLKFFFSFIKPHRKAGIITIITLIITSILAVFTPYVLKLAIDNYIIPMKFSELWKITSIYAILILIGWIVDIGRIYLISYLGQVTVHDMRNYTFDHLTDLSMDFFENEETGKLVSILTNDIDTVAEFLRNGLTDIVTNLLRLIGIIIIMFILSPGLTLVTLLVTPFITFIFYIVRKYAREAYREIRKSVAKLTAKIAETINGITVIKVYAQEERVKKEFGEINEENYRANIKQNIIVNSVFPLIRSLSSIAILLLVGYAVWVNQGLKQPAISVGTIVAFIRYEGMLFDPILSLTMFYSLFQSAMAALERVKRITSHESSIKEDPNPLIPKEKKGKLVFDNVWFSYDKQRFVLKEINLQIDPGESVALVGHTGAGKSTIGKLILRYYDPDNGKITLDDVDLRKLPLSFLSKKVVLVPQEPFLFNNTIMYNLKYGHFEVTDEEVYHVSKEIGLDRVINKFPQKYDTIVGPRGVQLSQGEKQLLSFARALLSKPLVVVLDEATASVDPFTEYEIQKATEKILENATTIIIAHRLSTLKNVDRIIVMEEGEIVEQGKWNELIKKQGYFYDYYKAQVLSEMSGLLQLEEKNN